MTTINSYSMTMPPSPRAMMDRRIDAAVEAGSLSEVDEAALDTALDSIDSALSASASDGTSRLDPSEMKDRIDSLIADQVSSGTLTQDQAAALQSFFAQGGPQAASASDPSGEDGMSIDAMSGPGGPGAMRGPPPGPPPAAASDEDDSSTTSATDAASAADQLESIIAFLDNLRASLSQSLYGNAASSADSSNSGLVIDSLA